MNERVFLELVMLVVYLLIVRLRVVDGVGIISIVLGSVRDFLSIAGDLDCSTFVVWGSNTTLVWYYIRLASRSTYSDKVGSRSLLVTQSTEL